MRMRLFGALVALLTVAPGVAWAQDKTDSTTRDLTRRYRVREMQSPRMAELTMLMGQPRLGLMLTNDSTRKQGAVVSDVMDDSPAQKAGLKKGDIITKMNGTSLSGDDPAGTIAGMAHKLEPGDTVRFDYRRDGASRSATLVAADMGGRAWAMRGPAMTELRRLQTDMPRTFTFAMRGTMGLDLVEMNAGLGEYFGIDTGLLVTETPRDSSMPLRAGDVIVTIGGRTPNDEMHAARILGSYAPGETVKFEIMRKKNRQTVSWTVPEDGVGRMARPARRDVKVERS